MESPDSMDEENAIVNFKMCNLGLQHILFISNSKVYGMLSFSVEEGNHQKIIVVHSVVASGLNTITLKQLTQELKECMDRLRIIKSYILTPSGSVNDWKVHLFRDFDESKDDQQVIGFLKPDSNGRILTYDSHFVDRDDQSDIDYPIGTIPSKKGNKVRKGLEDLMKNYSSENIMDEFQ